MIQEPVQQEIMFVNRKFEGASGFGKMFKNYIDVLSFEG
jgi:hypothetical protein